MPPAIPGAPPPQPGNYNLGVAPTASGAALGNLDHAVGFPQRRIRRRRHRARATRRRKALHRRVVVAGEDVAVGETVPGERLRQRSEPDRARGDVDRASGHGRPARRSDVSNYQDLGGVKVPTKIVQKRGGLQTFEATITGAARQSIRHRAVAAAAGAGRRTAGGAPPAPAPAARPHRRRSSQRSSRTASTAYWGYGALAVEFKDHVVILEGDRTKRAGSRSSPRRNASFRASRSATWSIPTRISIIPAGSRRLPPKGSRSLRTTTIAPSSNARSARRGRWSATRWRNRAQAQGRRRRRQARAQGRHAHHRAAPREESRAQRRDADRVSAEGERALHRGFQHAGRRAGRSPAIVTLVQNVERLKLDFDRHILVHPPNPDRPLTRADLMALAKGTQ